MFALDPPVSSETTHTIILNVLKTKRTSILTQLMSSLNVITPQTNLLNLKLVLSVR